MSAFPNQHRPFVLNSPYTFGYQSSLLREECSGDPGIYFSSNFPDAFFQEISGQHAENHGAIILDEANLQVPCKLAVNPSAVAKQASDSTAIPMELERKGDHQQLPAELSALENRKMKVAETKVEREKKREKQRKSVRGVEKPKESRLKPGVKNKKKVPEEVEKHYVHVRARRGEATDKHSLAERVRREKISAKMKLLQSLVPGCDTITGKTQILDEIIRYVQFLQHQVESFSAKIALIDSLFGESEVGLITNTLLLEEFSSLAPPLPPYDLESSSVGQLAAFTASSSSLLPQPDRHQRLNITAQDQKTMLSETQYRNQKLVYEHHGLDGFSSIRSKGES